MMDNKRNSFLTYMTKPSKTFFLVNIKSIGKELLTNLLASFLNILYTIIYFFNNFLMQGGSS